MKKSEFENLKKYRSQLLDTAHNLNAKMLTNGNSSYLDDYGVIPEVWEDGMVGKVLFGLLVVKDKILEEIKNGKDKESNLEKITLIDNVRSKIIKLSNQIDEIKGVDVEKQKKENREFLEFLIYTNLIDYSNNSKDNGNYASLLMVNKCLELLETNKQVQVFDKRSMLLKSYDVRGQLHKYMKRKIDTFQNYEPNRYEDVNKYQELSNLNSKLGLKKTYKLLGLSVPPKPRNPDKMLTKKEIDELLKNLGNNQQR